MIYTAKLNIPVKKAFDKQAVQSTSNKIIQQLALDPDVTKMDVVILGDRDFEAPATAQKLQKAIDTKHPDICVIYLYQKEADADRCNCEFKKRVKKMSAAEVTDAFTEFVGEHNIRQGKQRVSSADFDVQQNDVVGVSTADAAPMEERVPVPTKPAPTHTPRPDDVPKVPSVEEQLASEPEPEAPAPIVPEVDNSQYTEAPKVPLETITAPEDPFKRKEEFPTNVTKEEAYLAGIHSFEDWVIFKEHLNHESVIHNLISENSEYVGLINVLDVLDQRINTVWRDQALTPDQKFDKIKEIGLERSVIRATTNSQEVEKVVSIISTIVLAAKRTVEERVQSLDTALYKITTDKSKIADTSYIDKAINERSKIQLELLNISRGIVDIFKSSRNLVQEEIQELDRRLPSSSAFINDMVKPIGTQIFTPQNTSVLANKLMQALQENSIIASQLEESVNAVIENLFNLCQKDEETIRYQQNMLNLLKAHRVEDVIITNTLLKECMKLYVGSDNTGRSATAITWSGVLSRRQNTLLIDLTGRSKFRDYGITPISLDEFMHNRIEKQLLCVEVDHILAPDELQDLVQELKARLNYYRHVNVILAPEDHNGLVQLSEEAKTVHYITDCSTSSIHTMRDIITSHKSSNIARKLICIDAPVSPLMIADAVGADPTATKVITLPTVPAIRACALRHDRPYEFDDVICIFEEAFR